MSDTPENTAGSEPIAGTNLTTVPEFNKTAMALAELEQRLGKLVPDTSTKKGLEALTKDVAELRTLRTGVEKKRKELKAPLIEQEKKLDAEAARITGKIVVLEEPLKLQLDEANNRIEQARLAKLEEDRQRVDGLKNAIFAIRETPASLIGKPSNIINGSLVRLRTTELVEAEFAEFYDEARDALDASIARVRSMYEDALEAEAQAEKTRLALEELETLRREKEEREAADRKRAMDEARELEDKERAEHAAAEAQRLIDEGNEKRRVQGIQSRISSIVEQGLALRGMSSVDISERRAQLMSLKPEKDDNDFAEFYDDAVNTWVATEEVLEQAFQSALEREKLEAEQAAERERDAAALEEQRQAQAIVEAQQQAERDRLAKLQREAEQPAETERLANLGLRQAAKNVIDYFFEKVTLANTPTCIGELEVALDNDAKRGVPAKVDPAKPAPHRRAKVAK